MGHALGTDGKPAGLAPELDDLAKEFEDPGRGKEKPKGRPAAAEHGSLALEEEWDDEVFEALGLSEDEDNFRDSLEHAAKNAANMPETQLVLVGGCCGGSAPSPPAVLSARQKEAVNGLAKACVGCLGNWQCL